MIRGLKGALGAERPWERWREGGPPETLGELVFDGREAEASALWEGAVGVRGSGGSGPGFNRWILRAPPRTTW